MTTIQAIAYTTKQTEWRELAGALGLTPDGPPAPVWEEHAGHGLLALHGVDAGGTIAGTTETHLLVPDLDALVDRLTAGGFTPERTVLDDVGPTVVVTDAHGVAVSATEGARTRTRGPLAVMPLQYTPDVAAASRLYEALGLTPQIVANADTWADFTAEDGGLAALHHAETARVELSFYYTGNIAELADRLRAHGHEPTIVDEAYNRTLLVATPDRGDLWVNERQDDLYGYSRAG